MKKPLLLFFCSFILLVSSIQSTAQRRTKGRLGNATVVKRDSSISKTKRLEDEVYSLREYVDSQQNVSIKKAADIYRANYNKIVYTADLIYELYDVVNLIERDKKEQITLNKINQVNNPTSDILGFKLIDIINSTLDETMQEHGSTIPEVEKKPIKSILNNLVQTLGKTFPPLQLFSSVVSTISSFTVPTFFVSNPEDKVKKVSDVTSNVKVRPAPLDSSFVVSFSKKMSPYITFYLSLNKNNTNLEEELDIHSFNYKNLPAQIKQMTDEFEKNTGIQMSDRVNMLNKLMNYSSSEGNPDFKYEDYNEKEEVKYVNRQLPELYDFVKEFNGYSKEYIFIVGRNVDKNKEQLKQALQLPKSDSLRINTLIREIDDQRSGPDGFLTKYNIKIDKINKEIKMLKKQ